MPAQTKPIPPSPGPSPEAADAGQAPGPGVPSETDETIVASLDLTPHQVLVLRALLTEQAARLDRERDARRSLLNPGSSEPELGSVYRSVLAIMAKLDGTAPPAE